MEISLGEGVVSVHKEDVSSPILPNATQHQKFYRFVRIRYEEINHKNGVSVSGTINIITVPAILANHRDNSQWEATRYNQ